MRTALFGVIGEIDSLPGCTQVAVSHAVFVMPALRGKGTGKLAHAARLTHLRDLGYDYALCTVQADNAAQVRIMELFSWRQLDEFVSSKTGHSVRLYGRRL